MWTHNLSHRGSALIKLQSCPAICACLVFFVSFGLSSVFMSLSSSSFLLFFLLFVCLFACFLCVLLSVFLPTYLYLLDSKLSFSFSCLELLSHIGGLRPLMLLEPQEMSGSCCSDRLAGLVVRRPPGERQTWVRFPYLQWIFRE